MTKDELLDIIRNAFATKPLPSKIAAAYTGGNEGEEADALFSGKAWTEIGFKEILDTYNDAPASALHFITREAVQYYLPLFMSLSLKHYPDDYGITESLLLRFQPVNQDNISHIFGTVTTLPNTQKAAIACYLAYFAQATRSRIAIESLAQYWKQFL